jgi:hypothetical protein
LFLMSCNANIARCAAWCSGAIKRFSFSMLRNTWQLFIKKMIGVRWYETLIAARSLGGYAPICKTIYYSISMKTWRQDSIRFFAISASDKHHSRNIWVTATSTKEVADHYRAEIRIGSTELDCSINFSALFSAWNRTYWRKTWTMLACYLPVYRSIPKLFRDMNIRQKMLL